MKHYKQWLFAASLSIIAGCNSGSSSSETKTVTRVKPAADYNFNDEEIAKLVNDREQYRNSLDLSFDGAIYHHVKFAQQMSDELMVVKLADNYDHDIDLMIDFSDDARCIIYKKDKYKEVFDCGEFNKSITDDSTFIQSTSIPHMNNVMLTYENDKIEYLPVIGSTLLTVEYYSDQIDILTSFVFKDFYNEFLKDNQDITERDLNRSSLGLTTYQQLSNIVQDYYGQNMLLKFDNHIGGSMDDDINMYTGLMIRNNHMGTMVTRNGSVFSGGTDLFTAGEERILELAQPVTNIELTKQVGVHSWAEDDKTAKEFPFTDLSHRKQATYFAKMLGNKGVDFYLYTLDSAPASGEHWVTNDESAKYGLISASYYE
ncbi:alpha/beta hydrolase [Photobacterium leiognathi subsp. mandapamensis]|uniref:alpha/beta hydrolase n=1 Tax=Photobacterium leiognathi TaxID=553611 RepID=UPI003AF37338